MTNTLNGAEKVLYKATYEFHKSIGATDQAAKLNAEAKIQQKRKMAGMLAKKGFKY